MSSKLLRGTFVLTLGTYISRILGMIYLIPFGAMVGATGGALFQYGYNQYTLFLNIATMGFPAAVSKFVSKYNSKGDYETSRRMLRAGMSVMLVTGMIAFSILYISAPFFAETSLGGTSNNGLTIDHVVYVIRMVSLALLVVPIMSLVRGFFQGHQMMGPTAVSQVVEQTCPDHLFIGRNVFDFKSDQRRPCHRSRIRDFRGADRIIRRACRPLYLLE